jgi:uncharacterized membrane protein YgcG
MSVQALRRQRLCHFGSARPDADAEASQPRPAAKKQNISKKENKMRVLTLSELAAVSGGTSTSCKPPKKTKKDCGGGGSSGKSSGGGSSGGGCGHKKHKKRKSHGCKASS